MKSPGDQRAYLVGNATVRTTAPTPLLFSQHDTGIAWTPPFTFTVGTGSRQVVVLQCVDEQGGITWQTFFYGQTSNTTTATNARAVSVWPETTPADTRVAICGEAYDRTLPGSATSFPAANATHPTGFIAVFNGSGDLLWTHHVFGTDPNQSCAITDIALRVEGEGEQRREVVTYCGISTHGDPGPGTPLTPLLPFASGGPFMSSGATNHGVGQWDGIVGRVHRDATGTIVREFHSIVGGPQQDGLFGIAEIDGFRFVAVGGTKQTTAAPPVPGFPNPSAATVGVAGPHSFGVAMLFDANGTRPSPLPIQPLKLEDVRTVGSSVGESALPTLARDVVVGWNTHPMAPASGGRPWHSVFIVGSTADPAAFTALTSNVVGSLHGPTDGFLAAFVVDELAAAPARLLSPSAGTFHGGEGEDGLCGIQSWNEFGEWFAVTGFSGPSAGRDLTVGSYFWNNAPVDPPHATGNVARPNGTLEVLPLRIDYVPASGTERPAVVGAVNATAVGFGLAFDTGLLGDPAGGGIAVDPRGRVTTVGDTNASDMAFTLRARDAAPGPDAVRWTWDMMPTPIGRTDRTGFPVIVVPPPLGGTTPACALEDFGLRITVAPTAGPWITGIHSPSLMRMLIDYEGDQGPAAPPNTASNAAVLVSRPTPQFAGILSVGILQFGVPLPTPLTGLWGPTDLSDTWVGSGVGGVGLVVFVPVLANPWRLYRATLPPADAATTGFSITAQMVTVLSSPVGPGGACTSMYSASPALWFQYL